MVNVHIVVLSAAVMALLGLLCALAAHRPGARGARRERGPATASGRPATTRSGMPSDPTLSDPMLSDLTLADSTLCDPTLADSTLCDPMLADPRLCDPALAVPSEAEDARPLDGPAIRRSWAQRCRQDSEAFRDIERVLCSGDPVPAFVPLNPPSIEQIAHDLRRLDRQRRIGPTRTSRRWLAEVERAYDERLCLACRCLGLDEHLAPLEGIDRDIERVRVEGQLEAAGLTLRA